MDDTLHLPEVERCPLAGGKTLPGQLRYYRTLGQPTLARFPDRAQQRLLGFVRHQGHAIVGQAVPIGHIATGLVSLGLLVGSGLSGALADGLTLPLRHRAQHVEHQAAGRCAGVNLLAHREQVRFAGDKHGPDQLPQVLNGAG